MTPEQFLEYLKSTLPQNNSLSPEKYRYALYVRKSTDESDNQIRSLSDQLLECKDMARRLNLRFTDEDIFEEAESAKEPGIRPKFTKMINEIKLGKYQGVIAWHPDRLARNMKDAGEIIDLVDKDIIKDLKFVSFTFMNDASGKMLLGMTFVLSKQYSDKLSDDVSRGNRHSLEEGKYINKTKHGYYKDVNQYLRPDGENFALIKNAFKMRSENKTLEEIASYLNDNAYSTIRKKTGRTIKKMDKQAVLKFLSDPVYTGVLKYGNSIINLMEIYDFMPTVTPEVFMQINGKSGEYAKYYRNNRRGEDIKADLLRGMVFCNECKESMSAGITSKHNRSKTKTTNYFYYRCENKACKACGKSVRAKVIVDYVKNYLAEKPFSNERAYKHFKIEMQRVSSERVAIAKQAITSFRAEKQAQEKRLRDIKDLMLSEKDEEIRGIFKGDIRVVDQVIEVTENKILELSKTVELNKVVIKTYSDFLELSENMANTMANYGRMDQYDFLFRKMFSNFYVNGKTVYKATLNSPFDVLSETKVSECGR